MTRIRTGNKRRKRALQRVADMNALPGNLQIMSIQCHNVSVASQQLSDIMRDVTKKIADAFRLPPEFVTSGPHLDIFGTVTGRWPSGGPVMQSILPRTSREAAEAVLPNNHPLAVRDRARRYGFTPAPGVIPGLWIKDGYPELTTNQMLAEIERIA